MAQENQKTFTDLVRQLVGRFTSDIEKARTIFRWITVKNLNTMQFDDDLRGDTPMGLLRGIKFGTESYHVLFKRLCRLVKIVLKCIYKNNIKLNKKIVMLAFTALSSRDIQRAPAINPVSNSRTHDSETRGTPFT